VPLPAYYIKKWTDTQIQVYVPSFVPLANNTSSNTHAGTGLIKITKSTGEGIYSSTNLNIPYSYDTKLVTAGQRWQRLYLVNKYCQKGIRFGVDTTNMWRRPADCATPAEILGGINAAMQLWSNTIGGDSIRLEAVLLDKSNPRLDINGKITFHASGGSEDMATGPYANVSPLRATLPTGSKIPLNLSTIHIDLKRSASKWWVDPTLTLQKMSGDADFLRCFYTNWGML
jgi:hypothetical protein